jgi:hypothetical protein
MWTSPVHREILLVNTFLQPVVAHHLPQVVYKTSLLMLQPVFEKRVDYWDQEGELWLRILQDAFDILPWMLRHLRVLVNLPTYRL